VYIFMVQTEHQNEKKAHLSDFERVMVVGLSISGTADLLGSQGL